MILKFSVNISIKVNAKFLHAFSLSQYEDKFLIQRNQHAHALVRVRTHGKVNEILRDHLRSGLQYTS